MAVYNFMKAEDRERCRADREAEIAAVDAGLWPRNADDDHRWGPNKVFADHVEKAQYARKMCCLELDYLKAAEKRIRAGDLPGWEPAAPTAEEAR